jgi:fatty acid synthase subunit alpha, fungi type
VLTVAREAPHKFPSPLLDISYRRRQLDLRRRQIKAWTESEYDYLQDEIAAMKSSEPELDTEDYLRDRVENIERESQRQLKSALNMFGNEFYKQDERIAPLRGALAVWGLTLDDLGVASMHGTSTVANDKNETGIISDQMAHLGKSKGCVTLCVFQKYLTGHPKGAAAAWQVNGALQMLATGLVPGNRNADNVCSEGGCD